VCYPCAAMQARCCCDSQNALVEERCATLRCHASAFCCDSQNALVQEGCAIPALPCKLAAVVIQNALVEEGCAIPALPCSKLAAVVIHRMLWCKEGCAIPALSCMQAVMIHRMLWWKKVCYPALPCISLFDTECSGGRRVCYPCAAMQARCCCDSQNALVQGGVLSLRCHASKLLS
jgi:hypothetical protein